MGCGRGLRDRHATQFHEVTPSHCDSFRSFALMPNRLMQGKTLQAAEVEAGVPPVTKFRAISGVWDGAHSKSFVF